MLHANWLLVWSTLWPHAAFYHLLGTSIFIIGFFYHKVNILQDYYAFSSNVSFHIQQVLKL